MTRRTTHTATPAPHAAPTRRRRAVAAVVLGASSTLLVGCSAADVQSFFTSVGVDMPTATAEKIAAFLTKLETAKREHERPKPCPAPTTTAAPTTEAPTTTVTVNPTVHSLARSSAFHGGCERRR